MIAGAGAWGADWRGVLVLLAALTAATAQEASAQVGALVSPGRLSRPHASLEGISKCLSCHAPGQGVAADRCLSCHKPVAARIRQKKGVHREVTTDCVACHVEHAGVDGELRPFDQRRFDHADGAGFPLDGLHAPLSAKCAACHKGRSFLEASPSCASCHTDTHKGSLGTDCARCHSAAVPFKDARAGFDHGKTAFALTGAHQKVDCASCHKNNTYKGVAFASCASCHTSPHRQPFAAPCASCHTTQSWRTAKMDHARTTFPLRGRHAAVPCVKCHAQPAMIVRPASQTCATCHADPHRGRFAKDCGACHNESGFAKGAFDHATTRFPLTDAHAGLACAACHGRSTGTAPARSAPRAGAPFPPVAAHARPRPAAAVTDFSGLRTECASCHTDAHAAELGARCEACHSTRTFAVATFTHAKPGPFFAGQHAALRCEQCHTPARSAAARPQAVQGRPAAPPARMALVGLTRTAEACASCHADVHAGQLGTRCETCHSVQAAKFAVAGFDHGRTRFPLAGRHASVACEACHTVETRAYPAGTARARHFAGVGTACASCHDDPHAGQLPQGCDRCHTVESFKVQGYRHLRARALPSFFTGRHATASCRACHPPAAPRSGQPVAADFRTSTACTTCHTDVHRGALGPDCERCHKP